jgi:pimeloyl-ACP methyl ester carboxylesterase
VPVTLVSGTQDRVVDPGHNSERLHERIAGSELKLQPGVGHMTHYAHPDQVMEAIEEIAGRAGAPVHLRNPAADARARASESGS